MTNRTFTLTDSELDQLRTCLRYTYKMEFQGTLQKDVYSVTGGGHVTTDMLRHLEEKFQ